MTEISADSLKGRSVIDSRGTSVGKVDDVAFDPLTWKVQGLVVNLDRDVAIDLRMKPSAFSSARLELSPERVRTVGDNVILNVDTDELAGMVRKDQPTE